MVKAIKVTCPNGIEFQRNKAMCAHYSIKYSTYMNRLRNGWTKAQALELDSPPNLVICPKGLEFPTKNAMYAHYGVTWDWASYRLKEGWSLSQVLGLEERLLAPEESIVCPNGLAFKSVTAMCRHYGLTPDLYRNRKFCNWTERQALNIDPPPKSVVCPKGIVFNTKKEMLKHYGVSGETFNTRISRGCTETQALGIEPLPWSITCPNGLNFRSEKQMCEHYGVDQSGYKVLMTQYNWTLAQALGIEPKPKSVVCPRGITHDSTNKMCKYYNISLTTYSNKINRGWTMAQALGLEPPKAKDLTITCPSGIGFATKVEMCKYYGITRENLTARLKYGWTERQALGIDPPPKRIRKVVRKETQLWNDKLYVVQKEKVINEIQFYLVQDKETLKNYVLTEEQIKTYPQCLQVFKKATQGGVSSGKGDLS